MIRSCPDTFPATYPLLIGTSSTRDLDQVYADLHSPKHLSQHQTSKLAEDLPGLGQWYCVECAKWFEGENSLVQHRRGKVHKRRYRSPVRCTCLCWSRVLSLSADSARVRLLQEKPYTQKEAEASIGLTTDNGKQMELKGEATERNGTQSEGLQHGQIDMT